MAEKMAEYIEREKLYNNLILLAMYETGERQQGILGCAETVRIFSAADVAPLVHGQWIATHGDFCSCSLCMYPMAGWMQKKYCPNCGAKMDGTDGE